MSTFEVNAKIKINQSGSFLSCLNVNWTWYDALRKGVHVWWTKRYKEFTRYFVEEYLLITDILWREYRYLLILLYMYSLIDIKCALLKQIWSRIRYRIQPLWCIEVCTMRSRVPHLNCIPIFSCFNEIMFCKISLFIYIFMSLLVYSW